VGFGYTLEGRGFYAHAETPGLGGEVDNPRWLHRSGGTEVYGEQGGPRLRPIQGRLDANAEGGEHKVDVLSGATLSSRGVENLVNYWMGDRGYAPFLNNLRQGEV